MKLELECRQVESHLGIDWYLILKSRAKDFPLKVSKSYIIPILSPRIVYYLMNVHITPRTIYLTRHGKTKGFTSWNSVDLFKNVSVGPGWPDWANFRQLGDRLFWAVFWKLHKYPTILCCFFPRLRLYVDFCQKMGWAKFWAAFTNSSGHPCVGRINDKWQDPTCEKGTLKISYRNKLVDFCNMIKN
jgi:hypothetical protein